MKKLSQKIIFTLFITLISISPLYAADTTEVFDVGATDFEFYTSFNGIGLDKYQKSISSEVVAGFGLTENISATIGLSGESNEYFSNGSGSANFGIFGTAIDSDHFDFDLFLSADIASDNFGLIPAVELNFDLKPDTSFAGLYLRAEELLAGRNESTETEEKHAFAGETILTIGAYYTISEKQQILLEYDMSILNNPADDEDDMNIGGVALGYNHMISDAVELISQVYYDIPQDDEDSAFGISLGFVASLPAVK